MIIQIADFLDFSDPHKPIEYDKHRETMRAVMALRLTCKLFAEIAFPHLFRTYCLLPSELSWFKLGAIATSDRLRGYLETLALEKHNEGTQRYKERMRAISDDVRYRIIDLSLIPKLKVLKAEDKWLVTKKAKSKIEIPRGQYTIHAVSFTMHHKAIWSVLSNLTKPSSQDFEFVSLNCPMGLNGPWRSLLNMDFSRLRYLRLTTIGVNANLFLLNLPPDIALVQRFRNLPNLEEFHLNQFFVGREEEDSTVNFTANVLQILQKKNWPRLRHLDLRFLTTTVADLWTFVAPHEGKLAHFQMHSGLVCTNVTEEEREQRYILPHWIRTIICPRGGGTTFEHYGVSPGTFYETPEDYDQPVKGQAGDVDGDDLTMGDYDDDAEFVYFERDAQGDIIMADL